MLILICLFAWPACSVILCGTGLVGLLLTRQGLRNSAKWTCREQWLVHDKLVIGLNDEDYRKCY